MASSLANRRGNSVTNNDSDLKMVFVFGLIYVGLDYLFGAPLILALKHLCIFLIFGNILQNIIKSYNFNTQESPNTLRNILLSVITCLGCLIVLNSNLSYSWLDVNPEGFVLGIILVVMGSLLRK